MILGILMTLVTGLLIGSIAYALVPGGARAGLFKMAMVGIVGSTLGGIALLILVGTAGGLLGAVLGATALVWFGRLRHERVVAKA